MQRADRSRTFIALAVALLSLAIPAGARAQMALPDVDVALVLEVHDLASWGQLYRQVLGTTAQPLGVSVASGTGRRSVTVQQPKFDTTLVKGSAAVRVTIYGKIGGHEALGGLTDFQVAVLEQSNPAWNHVVISYGLASTGADLLELHVSRP